MLPKEYPRAPYSKILVPAEDGGYGAEVLEFPGCISEGETAEEAMANLDDAMVEWVRAEQQAKRPIPEPLGAHGFSGHIALRLPRSLHRQAARRARQEGVSLNQWLVAAVAERCGAEGYIERLLARAPGALVVEVLQYGRTMMFDTPLQDSTAGRTSQWLNYSRHSESSAQTVGRLGGLLEVAQPIKEKWHA